MGGSIIRRIITGFGIVLLLAIIIAGVGLKALANARAANIDVSAQVLIDDVKTRDADAHFMRADQALLRALLDPSDARWRSVRDAEIKLAIAQIAELRQHLDSTAARQEWADIDSLLHDWDNTSQRIITNVMSGKRDDGLTARSRELVPLVERIETSLAKVVAAEVRDTRNAIDASQANIKAAMRLLWIASILTIIAGLFFSWLVTRSVTQPLREATGVLATSSAEILAATSEQARRRQ